MRITILSLFFLVLLVGCKNDSAQKASVDESELAVDESYYTGDFVYYADAAVLQTTNDVFSVQIDEKMHELSEKAKEFQRTPYDLVQVKLTGELIPNPLKAETGEGWDQMLVIDQIIEVSKATTSSVMQAPTQE